jgi:KDO2-lipid IV(A) lauroyltransferase
MEPRFAAPRYWATWLLLGVLRTAAALPFAAQLAVGRALGATVRVLPIRWVSIARRNLEICFPELDAAGRERLLKQHFAALGIGMVEAATTWWTDDRQITARSQVEGLALLDEALAEGRGVIVLTAHFTTIEIGARILNARRPIHVVYRPLGNDLLAAVSGRHFGRRSRGAIERDDVRAMVRALRRNEVLWYAPDQAFRRPGARAVPFFGVDVPTNVFTARLAATTGARVLYYACERLPGRGGYRATLSTMPEACDPCPIKATRAYHALIEAQVRRIPEQYWWVHRRFKSMTPAGVDPYARRERPAG